MVATATKRPAPKQRLKGSGPPAVELTSINIPCSVELRYRLKAIALRRTQTLKAFVLDVLTTAATFEEDSLQSLPKKTAR